MRTFSSTGASDAATISRAYETGDKAERRLGIEWPENKVPNLGHISDTSF